MKDYDEVVAFCNSKTVEELIKDDPEIREVLVVSDLIPDTDVIVVKKQEFLDWLYEGNIHVGKYPVSNKDIGNLSPEVSRRDLRIKSVLGMGL